MNGRHEQKMCFNWWQHVAPESIETSFRKRSPETNDTKSFTASQEWLHRFRNRFGLKNKSITGEAASANEKNCCQISGRVKEGD